MQLNANLNERAQVDSTKLDWIPSPLKGVTRRMLERDGDEVARATTIVRYAPESYFDGHLHELGEEYFVLEGVFSDEHGDFGPGFYVRNPPGSRHRPHSDKGCTILVKLRQMDPEDRTQVAIDTSKADFAPTSTKGISRLLLHKDAREEVTLLRFDAGAVGPFHAHTGGEEIFVLEGSLTDGDGTYSKGTWLRLPHATMHALSSASGALIYQKTGHLPR
ncbi:MAG: cupin domain-containing protein [Alphaproteobacteria bacterium]|nr:cupin domain-containing protein [Alphaproteobacteria bacterium]MBO6627490.1 cupin domain-containing protein [Alphaproteobacteria bacterium]MDF1627129.1 cupin domain-containing protein [Parvibaculaceae bacterium]